MNTHSHTSGHAQSANANGKQCCPNDAANTAAGQTIDPVCGMAVDPATTPHHATHAGTDYHFCSARCREKFVADPAR